MKFCNEIGIPHSQFLEWDQDDRDKALAFVIEQAAYCQLCGTAEWEWEKNPYAYTPTESFCKGCYLKGKASEDAGNMPGTTVLLAPNTQELRDQQRRNHIRRRNMDMEDQEELDDIQTLG